MGQIAQRLRLVEFADEDVHPTPIPTEYVSPSGGIGYGLEYPFRYKEDGASFVVFSTLDGWVWRRFSFLDQRGDAGQRRFFSERAANRFCQDVNGIPNYASPEVLAEMDAQE